MNERVVWRITIFYVFPVITPLSSLNTRRMARTANGLLCAFHRNNSRLHSIIPSRLSHAEVESLSARNSVERRLPAEDGKKPEEKVELATHAESGSERQKLRLTKSCPGGPPQTPAIAGRSQLNGLMKKSEIQMLREEQVLNASREPFCSFPDAPK